MGDLIVNFIDSSSARSKFGEESGRLSRADRSVRPRRKPARSTLRFNNWRTRSERWGCLMVAAQSGERRAYEQLLRELDAWLHRYYARRLAGSVADDARQDALLAIHANRFTYAPSKPFGPWLVGIARHKWIDHLRNASRFAAVSLNDEIPMEDHGEAAISSVAVNNLLGRLRPAQAAVIRLVKLQGVTVEGASGATGQSVALVKVNIHRGLKKLAELATCDAAMAGACTPKAPDRRAASSRQDEHSGCNQFGRRSE
jgi:RNA polymerase sigma factor (sigma-70 family)